MRVRTSRAMAIAMIAMAQVGAPHVFRAPDLVTPIQTARHLSHRAIGGMAASLAGRDFLVVQLERSPSAR